MKVIFFLFSQSNFANIYCDIIKNNYGWKTNVNSKYIVV